MPRSRSPGVPGGPVGELKVDIRGVAQGREVASIASSEDDPSGRGGGGDQDVAESSLLASSTGGPDGRRDVSSILIKGQDDAALDEGFERLELTMKGLACAES